MRWVSRTGIIFAPIVVGPREGNDHQRVAFVENLKTGGWVVFRARFLRFTALLQPLGILPRPRANRFILPGHIDHLTHRCHDRQFLFPRKDRNGYRRRLREALVAVEPSLLTYNITPLL